MQRWYEQLGCSPVAAVCSVPPAMLHLCSKPHHPTHPVAATFCVPTKGSAHGNVTSPHRSIISPLSWRLCSCLPPLFPVPLPGLAFSLLLGQVCGLGFPILSQALG